MLDGDRGGSGRVWPRAGGTMRQRRCHLDRRWLMGGVRGEVVGDDRCLNQSQRGHMAGVGMVVRSAT
jgi:hypothetical protein